MKRGAIKKWTKDEESLLRSSYPTMIRDQISAIFPNRTLKSIKRKAEQSGLSQNEETRFLTYSLTTHRKWEDGAFSREDTSRRLRQLWANGKLKKLRGEESPCWKPKKEGYRDTGTIYYKEWRQKIFERDKFTCQICGKIGGTLHAHHIKQYADYESLRYNVDNGITLCKIHHTKIRRREHLYERKFMEIVDNKKLDKNQKIQPISFINSTKHKKGWGKGETWIINNEYYCAKILEFDAGKKCSSHMHFLKDECWLIVSEELILKYYDTTVNNGEELQKILIKGDIIHIPRCNPHQLIAIKDSTIWEISTTHFEEDSYRIAPGDSQTK